MRQKKMRAMLAACAILAGGLLVSTSAQAEGATAAMLANTCAGCHGTDGVAAGPAMPSIAGQPKGYIVAMLKSYKFTKEQKAERPSTIMGRVANGYTDEEIDMIADVYSKKKWVSSGDNPFATPVDPKLAKSGKKLAKKCEKCHEDGGRGMEDDTPRMAGQWLDAMLIQLDDYKNEALAVPQSKKMKSQMDERTLDELKAIAHYFASEK